MIKRAHHHEAAGRVVIRSQAVSADGQPRYALVALEPDEYEQFVEAAAAWRDEPGNRPENIDGEPGDHVCFRVRADDGAWSPWLILRVRR